MLATVCTPLNSQISGTARWQIGRIVVEIRWDEKAGLRRDAVRSQVIDVLETPEVLSDETSQGPVLVPWDVRPEQPSPKALLAACSPGMAPVQESASALSQTLQLRNYLRDASP